jgi:hypothetical protein
MHTQVITVLAQQLATGAISPATFAAAVAALGAATQQQPAQQQAAAAPKRVALPASVTAARKAARATAGKAASDAAATGQLLAWAQAIGCPVEAMPDGRLGLRKYRLEAALHKAYGTAECEDSTGHYLCKITEGLGRSPLVDSHRIETRDEAGRTKASTWYADRAGEAGVRVGGYTKNRKLVAV